MTTEEKIDAIHDAVVGGVLLLKLKQMEVAMVGMVPMGQVQHEGQMVP